VLGRRPASAREVLRLAQHVVNTTDVDERLLRRVVEVALDQRTEALDGVGDRHVDAGLARELLSDVEVLAEEPLGLAGTRDDDLVLLAELVDPEDRDDVLEVLVALKDLLDTGRDAVVLIADDGGVEDARGRVERVDGRVDAERRDLTREDRLGVQESATRRRTPGGSSIWP
jgi:PAS domain-containing protein